MNTSDIAAPALIKAGRRKRGSTRTKIVLILALVLPGLLLAILFKLVPLVRAFWLSLMQTRGFEEPSFAWFANYQSMFRDPTFLQSFQNGATVFLTLPVWVVLPLIVALLLFQRTPGWKLFRAVYFVPYMIAPVVVGIMFRQILAPEGPLNAMLIGVGLAPLAIEWLNGPTSALFSLTAVALWAFFGLGVLTYLSGLATVSQDVMEAARLDGAGFWRVLVSIAVPLIKPVIGYWTVLCMSSMLIWMFPLIYALTRGGPGSSTMLPEYLVFITTFEFLNRGKGAAIGMALFVFAALVSAFVVRRMYLDGKGERS
ncbi:ABC-type sugar transport system permease subunit [Devosia subaequoris]|uniref:ABC-type sugar transport system permease subunit n=1 Tax=Devosia subaequoris TaxID=395930 RepID=A0A7W6NDB5_9HYPH|nr:sugar ABC transporter permease [Devosia subaequoris]MBB4053639.1 ABC-type sugar transport system permease subunit [Devosia subaequoris]MCP1211226.1 sugar ABC transporter permease [Devosia subaequoris]